MQRWIFRPTFAPRKFIVIIMKTILIIVGLALLLLVAYKVAETIHRLHHLHNCEYRADQVITHDDPNK